MPLAEGDKRKFLNSLPDEDFMRTQILIPLFQEMDFLEVNHTHGVDEKGKDLVLVGEDKFKELEYTAVIVKNESITNAASRKDKEIVSNVSSQIITTILSGYHCIRQKRKVHFNRIIVVSSKIITNSARPELIEAATKHQMTNVVFWDQSKLMEELDKHLPSIYLLGKGGLSKYFHSLKNICEKLNELKNISIYKGEVRDLIEVFVEPQLQRKVETIDRGDVKVKDEVVTLTEIVAVEKNCLIHGPAGSGKSTLIRSQILRLLFDYENRRGKIVPVFIKLKEFITDVSNNDKEKIGKYIFTYLSKKHGLLGEDVDSIFTSKEDKFVFFLDGYDELCSEKEIKVFEEFRHFLEAQSNIKYILTSRNKINFLDISANKIEDWQILDFNIKQVKSFLRKWLRNKHDKLLEALQDHNLLEHLPRTPLTMTLVAIIFDEDNDVELPSNLSELYKMFTELLLGRWNLDRTASTFYKANDKEVFLTDIAMYLHFNRKVSCTEEELFEVFKQSESKLGKDINYDNMLHELIVNTNLLVKNDRSEYEFRHLSFQEFFVANEIHSTNQNKILIKEFPSTWWGEILYFYCGIKKSNEKLLPTLMRKIIKLEDVDALKAICQMGYLVQSSYKTHATVRKALILRSSKHYAEVMTKSIAVFIEKNKKIPEIILYLSISDIFRIHFKSRFLIRILGEVYSELTHGYKRDFVRALNILLIANTLAELGEVDYLADVEQYYKDFPLLVLMENVELSYGLDLGQRDKIEKKEVRRIAARLGDKMKKNPQLYKKYLKR